MNKTDLVIKDNTLINASYTLSLTEQRIILLSIAKAQKSGQEINHNDYLSIYADEYSNNYNVDSKLAYRDLKIACDSILNRVFSYSYINEKGLKAIRKSNWFQSFEYIEGNGEIKILFTKELIPFINQLKERFTSYFLDDVSEMTSVYAIRLYELIIAWKSTHKTPVFELEEFRNKLGVEPEEYPRMFNFKKRVLDVAVNQINEHSNIKIEVEQHKRGRSISGFSFSFVESAQKRDLNTIDWISGKADKEKQKREKITVNELIKRHGDKTRGKSKAEILAIFKDRYFISDL